MIDNEFWKHKSSSYFFTFCCHAVFHVAGSEVNWLCWSSLAPQKSSETRSLTFILQLIDHLPGRFGEYWLGGHGDFVESTFDQTVNSCCLVSKHVTMTSLEQKLTGKLTMSVNKEIQWHILLIFSWHKSNKLKMSAVKNRGNSMMGLCLIRRNMSWFGRFGEDRLGGLGDVVT